ncbi:MAG: lamin tail domain-containing protein, partial [Marmoricola sp.]
MHPSRTRPVLPAAFVAVLALLMAGFVLVAPAFGASEDVKINEVESSGGTPVDWIELVNTGSAGVPIGGWQLKDNDDTHVFTIPAGTVIAPGAYLTFDVDVAGGFGLGSADSARLYDGTTLVDSYSWTAHAATTYGRCPNGTGTFATTRTSTKGAANDCVTAPVVPNVKINEVESNGDAVGDWVELKNIGSTDADVSGWKILDNDPAHVANPEVVPAGTVIQPGGYYALYTEFTPAPGFGLGTADSVTVLLPDGTTQVDTYSWTAHAAATYGRCPDGTGAFATTTTPTRGLANVCSPVRINEVESNGDPVGDWVELKNIGGTDVNIGGWVFKDNVDADVYTIPAGTVVPANGYKVLDVADFVFGLGGADSARLYDGSGSLVDAYTWTAHATQTYGRCKDGLGDFVDTTAPTKGAANACPGLESSPWPGGQQVTTADSTDTFVQDLSGLVFDPANPDVLWGAQNKKGTLFKLVRDANDSWVPAAGWPRDPKFLGGAGSPDTEGITIGPDGYVYLTSERDNDASGVSRNTILRYDPNSSAGATISPTSEWDLNDFLPVVGANLGLEGVTFVPDGYLTANGFRDQATGSAYKPSTYPLHGSGLFFVAFENNGAVYAFALDSDGHTAHKVATISSGFAALADIDFDPELGRVRAVTDDTVDGRTSLLKVNAAGDFVVDKVYDRPAGMPNLNNEGLAVAPRSRCVNGLKEVLWSDDGDTDGHSIRRGTISCTVPDVAQDVTITSTAPVAPVVGQTYPVTTTGGGSGNPVVVSIDPLTLGSCSLTGSLVHFEHPGPCTINARQAAAPGFLAGSATQSVTVGKAPQTITFAQPASTVYGGAGVPLVASADSGLPVTLTSQTPTVCQVDGSSANPAGAGTCVVTATQAGDGDHLAAAPVSRAATVAKAPVVVTTRSTSGLASLLTLRITYTSTVRSAVTGLPVAGVPVTTRIDGGSPTSGCTATTNAAGAATCTVGPVAIALGVSYTASAAETANFLA